MTDESKSARHTKQEKNNVEDQSLYGDLTYLLRLVNESGKARQEIFGQAA